MTHKADTAQLRSIVDRLENQAARVADEQQAMKDIYAEAKALGYDTPTLRTLIARRKKAQDDVAEADALLDLYESAL